MAEGTAESDRGEAEFVAEMIGGLGELLHFLAAVRIEEVELLAPVRERGQGHAKEADFAFEIAVLAEEI